MSVIQNSNAKSFSAHYFETFSGRNLKLVKASNIVNDVRYIVLV